MDAASCCILGMALIPVTAAEPTRTQFRKMLKDALRHKQRLPKTLFVTREDVADLVTIKATEQNIDVFRVSGNELPIFAGEARQAYAEHFEGPPR